MAFLLSSFALSINTTGFDFYYHVLSLKSWNTLVDMNGSRTFFDLIKVPRYLLGTHFFYFFSLGIIPLAWVVIIMHTVMVVSAIRYSAGIGSLLALFVTLFLTYNIVFVSMTGIALVLLIISMMAFRIGRPWRVWFFFAASFHPLGFVFSVITGIFYFPRIRSFILLLLVLFFSIFILSLYGDNNLGPRLIVDYEQLFNIAKERSMIQLYFFILPFFYWIMRKYFRVRITNGPLMPVMLVYWLIAVLLFIAAYIGFEAQLSRISLLGYLLKEKTSSQLYVKKKNMICAAWFSRKCYLSINSSYSPIRQKSL